MLWVTLDTTTTISISGSTGGQEFFQLITNQTFLADGTPLEFEVGENVRFIRVNYIGTELPGLGLDLAEFEVYGPVLEEVVMDIKPDSCPNPINTKSKGILPVAILGSQDFDVTAIDIASLRLNGVPSIRSGIEDVSQPANVEHCDDYGPDGFDDLTLKFDTQEVAASLGDVTDGDEIELTLTGALSDGTIIEGSDFVTIVKKGKN